MMESGLSASSGKKYRVGEYEKRKKSTLNFHPVCSRIRFPRYMSSTLLRVAGEHNSVVAVVGKGHLPGIKKHWKQPIELKELLEMPLQTPAISIAKILTTVGVAVAGVSILSGIYLSIKK